MKNLSKISILIFFLFAQNSYSQELSIFHGTLGRTYYYNNNNKINKKEFEKELRKDRKAYTIYKESKRYSLYSSISNSIQWITVALQVNEVFDNDRNLGFYYLIPNISFGVVTIFFKNKSRNLLRLSINEYNR